jgi:hypothetical protein
MPRSALDGRGAAADLRHDPPMTHTVA